MSDPATRTWLCGNRRVEISTRDPFLLGILNVTPDSFSDGGKFLGSAAAVRHGIALMEAADGLDVGGESTRPGAQPVSAREERKRVVGVLQEIRKEMPHGLLSVDTYKAEVARAAIEMAGVDIINDVGGGDWDPEMWKVLEKTEVGYICMHSIGRPPVMQNNPCYRDVVEEVRSFFETKMEAWAEKDIEIERMVLDVGIGFGKKPEHNRALLEADWRGVERPLAWGLSRKSFLGVTQTDRGLRDRDQALDFWNRHLWERGTAMIWRVHDPFRVRESLKIFSDDVKAVAR